MSNSAKQSINREEKKKKIKKKIENLKRLTVKASFMVIGALAAAMVSRSTLETTTRLVSNGGFKTLKTRVQNQDLYSEKVQNYY